MTRGANSSFKCVSFFSIYKQIKAEILFTSRKKLILQTIFSILTTTGTHALKFWIFVCLNECSRVIFTNFKRWEKRKQVSERRKITCKDQLKPSLLTTAVFYLKSFWIKCFLAVLGLLLRLLRKPSKSKRSAFLS